MFGDTLKRLRKSRGITQSQLADAIGVQQSSIGKYEGKSQVMPSYDVLIRIAEYFGVSTNYLLGAPSPSENLTPSKMADHFIQGLELELITIFRSMNIDGKNQLIDYARFLAQKDILQQDPPAAQTGA